MSAEYQPFFYELAILDYCPYPIEVIAPGCEVADDGTGVYIRNIDSTIEAPIFTAELLEETILDPETGYLSHPSVVSGPYALVSFDWETRTAVFEINEYYKGNSAGETPSIPRIVYRTVSSDTMIAELESGEVDLLNKCVQADVIDAGLALTEDAAYSASDYARSGYSFISFNCEQTAVSSQAVRQAIAYCMDRAKFAKDFTGGYGGVVDGPYYSGSWMYKAAVDQGMILNAYATSVDSAIEVLTEGGWVYDAEGNDYVDGVRYKKIPGDIATENDINYKSKDGAYVTTKVGDDYYMPLVLNWYGTSDNPFTDQLMTGFASNDNVIAAGFNVQYTIGDFSPMLDELYQAAVYGYYSGSPMYSVFNFATGFTSAAYDYSYQMTIDPAMYDDYSAYYIKDQADIFWLK